MFQSVLEAYLRNSQEKKKKKKTTLQTANFALETLLDSQWESKLMKKKHQKNNTKTRFKYCFLRINSLNLFVYKPIANLSAMV